MMSDEGEGGDRGGEERPQKDIVRSGGTSEYMLACLVLLGRRACRHAATGATSSKSRYSRIYAVKKASGNPSI